MAVKKVAKHPFSEQLLHWHYTSNRREMPWKGETDPYKIWLSEVILQQTRVAQGLPYFTRFIEAFPNVHSLAAAREETVFKLWEGLGYYSRCRNLLAGARQIVTEFNGVFPADYSQILSIKGVGPYTAAAISSFAFGLPYSVVDGNVVRVLSRFFGIDTPFDTHSGKKQFAELAQGLLVENKAADYNQAIMDFGATVCKPSDPLCGECPLRLTCVAFNTKKVRLLPVRAKKLVKKKRFFLYLLITSGERILVRQRQEKDIWQHLHEFYLVEDEAALDWTDQQIGIKVPALRGIKLRSHGRSGLYKQQLTHQVIFARFLRVQATPIKKTPPGYKWVLQAELDTLAFPGIINTFLANSRTEPVLLF